VWLLPCQSLLTDKIVQLGKEREEALEKERKKHEGDLKFELSELKQQYEEERRRAMQK
jgi:hypothetical protein